LGLGRGGGVHFFFVGEWAGVFGGGVGGGGGGGGGVFLGGGVFWGGGAGVNRGFFWGGRGGGGVLGGGGGGGAARGEKGRGSALLSWREKGEGTFFFREGVERDCSGGGGLVFHSNS